MQFERLFSGFRFKRWQLRNRIAVLPYGSGIVRDGIPQDGDIAHYENIARSGPALMFSGGTVMHASSAMRNHIVTEAYDPRVLPQLRRKAAALRAHGVVLFGQILHLGREWALGDADTPPMAPSAVRSPRDAYLPREMTQDDIDTIVEAFGQSARNLQIAGYDGTEIHGAHGYLVAQFLSPATNLRTDAYGGTAEKRLRFLLEIVDAIRRHCGSEFGLSVRLSADEEMPGGLGIADTTRIAKALESHGDVDLLNLTVGMRGAYVKDMTSPDATAANAAIAVRRECNLPILLGQRISRPEVAERVLAEGAADLIGMARAFLADPTWITKAASGQASRIRPCLNFNQDCRAFFPHVHCSVNPQTGRELVEEFGEVRPAVRPKRIAVIGGGPGGLEAALTARLRGHSVEVFEATASFGGQFLYAASVPHRQTLRRLIDWQLGELRLLGVPMHPDRPVGSTLDLRGSFDAAIVATGGQPNPLSAGLASAGAVRWWDILEKGAPAPHSGGRAVYVDDGTGFWWNYGVAEAIVQAGWKLVYVTPNAGVAHLIPHESAGPLLARLGRGPTDYRVLTTLDAILPGGARLVSLTSGEETDIPCDLVVVQTGRSPVQGPGRALRESGMAEVHEVGDCLTPRRMSFAVFEAQRVARSV